MSKNNMKFVVLEGGTGPRVGLSVMHLFDCKGLASKGRSEAVNMVFETMDAGAEEIGEMLAIRRINKELGFRDSAVNLACVKLGERVKNILQKDKEFCLNMVAPEWFQNELLLTKEELLRDLSGGYYRDLVLGSVVSELAMKCALETPEDKKAGFQAIVDAVIASNNAYEVRVVFIGSGTGGEGRTNLCMHPAILKRLCIQKVMDELHMQYVQAQGYVEKNLKIAVIMIGAAFRFPAMKGLNQDIAGMVAGTLRNYPEDALEAVNAFYLLEHDLMLVQAEKASDSGQQFKHGHAIELVAVAAMENFFNRNDKQLEKKCPIIPHYSLPGNAKTNWKNLSLPSDYRQAMSSRLRFDAVLFYWIRPQLILTSDERNKGALYDSEFLSKMFGGKKTGKKLKIAMAEEGIDVDRDVIKPLENLLERERKWLIYLKDISLTGMNWETGVMPGDNQRTELFPVEQIDRLLNDPDIKAVGGMTGFKLDSLTECQEGNQYHTDLTLDKIRSRIRYTDKGKPLDFMEIMGKLYDVCSEEKERRHGFFRM